MAKFDPYAAGGKIEQSAFDPHVLGGKIADEDASGQLIAQLKEQESQPEQARTPQMQEEFSNPTGTPEFANLSKQEQLKRIQLSQFDPANQTPTGGFVPPGTYESPATRMAATVLPQMAMPELSVGKNILSRYAINPAINTLARIGAGTAGNVAYESPEIKNMNQLKDVGTRSAGLNALLEAGTSPFRVPSYFAEMFNPAKFAAEKAGQIKNEFAATKATMNEMYRPVNEKYNDYSVTVTPKKYMDSAGIDRSDLYPDAKITYDNFIEEPNFNNLHKLQSKIGKDWSRASISPATEEKAQLFGQMQSGLKNKVQKFLAHDPNALKQYNLATEYAKNHHFPYLSTPSLRNISKGKMDIQPNTLAKSIDKATKKTLGAEDRSVIPEGHPLRNHLADLNRMNNFGNAAQYAVPAIGGTLAGELLHPGLGGALGGASALGASQMAKLASKFGAPTMTSFMQNPLVQGLFKKTEPWWYGAGRAGINASYPSDSK